MLNKNHLQLSKGIFAFTISLLMLSSCGKSKPEADTKTDTDSAMTYVRKNASTPAAEADLAALNKAMAIMKQMPCDTVQSWYYQAGIHSIPAVVPNGNPFCQSYTQMSQMKTAWMNCTHDPLGASEMHFLIWHRLYIWHLEQIVRKYSGKKDFALPYWDYTDTNYRVMPAIFRSTADSLYEAARLKSLNEGMAIDTFMNSRLDMTTNNQNKVYSMFNQNVDAAPHGAMHNYVGGAYAGDSTLWNRIYQGPNYGLMAQVESAAFDPIFWVHHSNIDYLWQKWDMSPNGARPILDSLLIQPWAYVFFDADGKKVTYTIQEAYNKAFNLDYVYEGLQDVPKPLKTKEVVPENREEIASVKVEQAINMSLHKLTVKVPSPKPQLLQAKDMSRKVTVLEVTVGFKRQPKQDYEVYVDTDKPNKAKLAGVMTFFGAMHMQQPAKEYTKVFRFDISDEFDLKKLNDKLSLLIVNSSGKKANEITVKNVKIETRNF